MLTSTSTSNALSANQGKVLKDLVDGKASSSHTHDDRYYTESEIDSKLSGKASSSHTHDDRYYTESEIDSKLSGKASSSHTQAYTTSELSDYTSDTNTMGTTPAGVKKAIKKCFSLSGTTLTINTNW